MGKLSITLKKRFHFADEPPNKKKKTRDTRHKKNKFETALGNFRDFLTEENNKQSTIASEMNKQWLDLEKMKVEKEQEERERERQHEMRLMQMFSAMIQSHQPPAPQQRAQEPAPAPQQPFRPVYTDLQDASTSQEYYSHFNFH